MNRRELILGASSAFAALGVQASEYPAAGSNHTSLPNHEQWRKLDGEIRTWWDADLIHATEEAIRGDESRALLFLPFPYLRVSASPGGTYYGQFSVDTAFTKYALFAHDRRDIVRDQLLNYLFMIERYGFVLNANMKGLVTRSQTPFFLPPTLWRYYSSTRDLDLLYRAYPLLKQEYQHYWNAPHHQTPTGLATNRDLGDPVLSPELASEAEVLDWTPVFGGDVRRCVPLATNSGLVSFARVLALIAKEVGRGEEAHAFTQKADTRTALIHKYCWNEAAGLFLEYDYVA